MLPFHMKNILGNISGDMIITEDTQLRATLRGNVQVDGKVILEVFGVVTGNINVMADAACVVHGVVNGNITGPGQVVVSGRVTGKMPD
jgi:cytoskeletal protein CcmA (bactofilin family)